MQRSMHNRQMIADLDCWLQEHFIPTASANQLMQQFTAELPWRQDKIRIFGRWVAIPRQQVFMGDPDIAYTYSGLEMQAQPWHPEILQIKSQISELSGYAFNAVLINLYRDGNDYMGWHRDNETELGEDPVIASVSLGAERRFLLREITDKNHKQELLLSHGSLLWMGHNIQQHWQHSVPKMKRCDQPRINLTFRQFPVADHSSE